MFVFMCFCFLTQDDIFPISTHLPVNFLMSVFSNTCEIIHLVNVSQFLHPFSVQGYLDYFQFLGIMNKAALCKGLEIAEGRKTPDSDSM